MKPFLAVATLAACLGTSWAQVDEDLLIESAEAQLTPPATGSSAYAEPTAMAMATATPHDHSAHEHTSANSTDMAGKMGDGHSHAMAEPGSGHVHMDSHTRPMEYINETYILINHAPDPPSYMDLDLREDNGANGHFGLLVLHVLLSCTAFFIAYPLALFLKVGRSPFAPLVNTAFLVIGGFGVFTGFVYSRASEDRYVGDVHPKLAYMAVLVVLAFNFVDIVAFGKFLIDQWRSGTLSWKSIWSIAKPRDSPIDTGHVPLTSDDDYHDVHWAHNDPDRSPSPSTSDPSYKPERSDSPQDTSSPAPQSKFSLRDVLPLLRVIIERGLVLFVWFVALTGIASWVGWCRQHYVNGCAAHSIKGSIFMWYGILSFSRYLGAFSKLGWAWNRHPLGSTTAWSAEFVESLVIFLYGISNTWLERLGKAGTPYGPKDIQHISIAVMFWFAGLLGMFLESRGFRKLLAYTAIDSTAGRVEEPPSYGFSFNPFPALCIGVTGAAMAAHNQAFLFQIQIHLLWGWLLTGFALCRILTYFFLYLRPPTSTLPSRPPTEALATFFLTCGGVMFILSIEQINFAAMRHNFDDMMGFLNVGIAITCVALVWVTILFVAKGAALRRSRRIPPVSIFSQDYEQE